MWKYILINILITAILICPVNAGQAASSECTINTWNTISALCAQAIIYPNDFINYVKKNMSIYSNDSLWKKCSELLAEHLVRTAWTRLSDIEMENMAKEIASKSEYLELWPKIIETTKPITESKIQLAYWINEISNATLEMMKGNITKYEETHPYIQMKNIWQNAENKDENKNINIMQQLSYEFTVWIILHYSKQV